MQNSGGIGPDDRPLYHFEFYDHVSMFDPEANSVFTFKLEPQTLYPIVLDKSRTSEVYHAFSIKADDLKLLSRRYFGKAISSSTVENKWFLDKLSRGMIRYWVDEEGYPYFAVQLKISIEERKDPWKAADVVKGQNAMKKFNKTVLRHIAIGSEESVNRPYGGKLIAEDQFAIGPRKLISKDEIEQREAKRKSQRNKALKRSRSSSFPLAPELFDIPSPVRVLPIEPQFLPICSTDLTYSNAYSSLSFAPSAPLSPITQVIPASQLQSQHQPKRAKLLKFHANPYQPELHQQHLQMPEQPQAVLQHTHYMQHLLQHQQQIQRQQQLQHQLQQLQIKQQQQMLHQQQRIEELLQNLNNQQQQQATQIPPLEPLDHPLRDSYDLVPDFFSTEPMQGYEICTNNDWEEKPTFFPLCECSLFCL